MQKAIKLSMILLVLSAAADAQAPAPANSLPFTLKPLGNNVWAAIDDAKGDAGANAGFVVGYNGVAVIDTFENAAAAKQLLAEIQKLTKLPVKYVINTHYHLDHVAGNGVFAETGAVIVGHRNLRGWIHTENLKFFGRDIKPDQRAMVEGLVPPDIVYDSVIELYLGSRRILVRSFPGHTGGDSVVTVPDAQVVFCGDLFWRKTLPNLIDASTDKWMTTLAKITGGSEQAVFVPGHGDVGRAADVQEFGGYLEALRTMAAQPVKDGFTGDALVNAVLPNLKQKYGSWNLFEYFARPNVLDMARELRGDKKIPQPST